MSRSFASRPATIERDRGEKVKCGKVQVVFEQVMQALGSACMRIPRGPHVPFVKINSCDTDAAITMYLYVCD